jgi:hypothetical protein
MKKILTLLGRLRLMKSLKLMLAIEIIFVIAGCTYTSQIAMTPKEGKMEIASPIPLEAGLLITEESKDQIFRSPPYPDFRYNPPIYYIEPYQLPIGEAFEKAAVQIFSQVFQKVHLIRSLDEAKNYRLVIEPKLADFHLHLIYNFFGEMRPYYALVEIQCKAKVVGTLINQGRTVWQKTIEPPLETRSQVYSSLLKNTVGEDASETIVLALKGLAIKIVEESIVPPRRPVRGWLEEIDQTSR